MDWVYWEQLFADEIMRGNTEGDPAHDMLHLKRVVKMAKELGTHEIACLEIVIPAAWFHDMVCVPKDSPQRSQASRLSAERAVSYLREVSYPLHFLPDITHAIEAHSFSAGIEPQTLEARVVQDADRLDALGAIGIARCFSISGLLRRPFYHSDDPFCDNRTPDDSQNTLDHFYVKLFKVAETLKTPAGQREGTRRVAEMKNYLRALALEIAA